MTFVDRLIGAVDAGSVRGVLVALHGGTEAERRAAVDPLRQVGKRIRASQAWQRRFDQERAHRLARIGTTPGAAAVAKLVDNDLKTDVIISALRERNPPWLPDLIERLLADSRPKSDWEDTRWQVAEAIRVHLDLPRPRTDRYLSGLALHWSASRTHSTLDRLREQPDAIPLVPALLRAPELGPALATQDKRPKSTAAGRQRSGR